MKSSKPYLPLGLLVATIVFVAGSAMATPAPLPDVTSTSVLLGVAVIGLTTVKRFLRR